MSLKDKLSKVIRRDEPAPQTPAQPAQPSPIPGYDPALYGPSPSAAPGNYPPGGPAPFAVTPPPADFQDEDRTIYEPDPGTVEQIRQLTAGWSNTPPPDLPPVPVAEPEPVAEAPATPTGPTVPAGPTVPLGGESELQVENRNVNPNDVLPVRTDGTVDYQGVYTRAGLRAPAFGAEQVLQMVRELPAEMSPEMRKQTVQVMVNTMGRHLGATPDLIVRDATDKANALTSFVDDFRQRLRETNAGVEAEIASLLALVEEKRRTLQGSDERLEQVRRQCTQEADGLHAIMDFLNASQNGNAPPPREPTSSWENAPSVEARPKDEEDTKDTLER